MSEDELLKSANDIILSYKDTVDNEEITNLIKLSNDLSVKTMYYTDSIYLDINWKYLSPIEKEKFTSLIKEYNKNLILICNEVNEVVKDKYHNVELFKDKIKWLIVFYKSNLTDIIKYIVI